MKKDSIFIRIEDLATDRGDRCTEQQQKYLDFLLNSKNIKNPFTRSFLNEDTGKYEPLSNLMGFYISKTRCSEIIKILQSSDRPIVFTLIEIPATKIALSRYHKKVRHYETTTA